MSRDKIRIDASKDAIHHSMQRTIEEEKGVMMPCQREFSIRRLCYGQVSANQS